MPSHRLPFVLAALLASASFTVLAQEYRPETDDHQHPHPAPLRGPADKAPAQASLATVSHTLYTQKSELYTEYKPLVAGKPGRLTAHLTTVGKNFQPYTAGQVTATLQIGTSTVKAVATAPERPGIFRFPLQPTQAGTGTLVIDIVTKEFTDRFTITGVTVYADETAAQKLTEDEQPGDLTYIKEKAWLLPDFATQPVARATIKKGKTVLPDVLALPLTAFVNVDGFPHVYVQRTGERFQLRRVETGPDDGQRVQITGGVKEGERVVIGGAQDILRATASAEHGHAH